MASTYPHIEWEHETSDKHKSSDDEKQDYYNQVAIRTMLVGLA